MRRAKLFAASGAVAFSAGYFLDGRAGFLLSCLGGFLLGAALGAAQNAYDARRRPPPLP